MATTTIRRLASAAVVTGIASLALAAPATAMEPINPDSGAPVSGTSTTVVTDDGWQLSQVATGALAGIALAGAGVAAAAGLRRHNHLAHPA